ncbi:hypothetical protein [Rhodococcus rhodochrous]|uniref:Uncharacterized protein n=1 Tax=Rhodococcus rhodochrous TaxID=1829 RepID=A0AA46WRR6_RHORH|nr:hypothetical protein [Rhodococcus rhodochrous]UZF43189.1 hypothetical protein KUM34_014845 [Rhodococcus rhodochrous]
MTENSYEQIAAVVITEASNIDPRFGKQIPNEKQLHGRVRSWAKVFERNGAVWPQEALDAVYAHYERADAFPIMPGDVIEYCAKQPVASSREHVSWWLDRWAQHPWSTAIEEKVGRPIPQLEPDSNDTADAPRLIEKRRAFIDEQRDFFIDQIIANADRKAITR